MVSGSFGSARAPPPSLHFVPFLPLTNKHAAVQLYIGVRLPLLRTRVRGTSATFLM